MTDPVLIHCVTDEVPLVVEAGNGRRRIAGRLIPFEVEAHPAQGPARVAFSADGTHTVDNDVWLNREHNQDAVLGRADRSSFTTDEGGMTVVFDILATTAGNDALVEAAAGARAGLSVEAEIIESTEVAGVTYITASHIVGAALTRSPAFAGAGVTDVAAAAASTTQQEENDMPETAAVAATEAPEATPTPTPAPVVEASRWAAPMAAEVGVSAAEFITAAANPATPRAVMRRYLEAATNNTTSDEIPGIIPESIVGQVITLSNDAAPLYSALGPKSAPAGKSFTLPILTADLADAAAAAELADVSGELNVDPATVTMSFIKRSVPLSQEAIIYSQPGITQIALDRLNAAISRGAETLSATVLEAVTGGNTPFAVAADGSDFYDELLAAAMAMEAACGEYPSHIIMAPDVVTALRGFKVSDGWNTPLIDTWKVTARGSISGDIDGLIPVRSHKLSAGYAALVSDVGVSTWRGPDARMTLADPNTMTYSIGGGVSVGLGVADPVFTTEFTVTAPI